MNVFIALLRGINVSGQKNIDMKILKELFESLDFINVTTYLQTGNVIFKSKQKDKDKIKKNIEDAIRNKFGFDVNVLIKTKIEFEKIAKNNPFKDNSQKDKVFIVFLYEKSEKEILKKLAEIKDENSEFTVKENAIYLYCKNGYGKSKLNNNFFERKLKISATTRNMNSISNIEDIIKRLEASTNSHEL